MIKHMFLHYNPCRHGFLSTNSTYSKQAYSRRTFGTLYIRDIPEYFLLIARNSLEMSDNPTVILGVGFTKLAYEDRFKYNRKLGKQLSQINCRFRDVKIESMNLRENKSIVHCTVEGFDFVVEYNHKTEKYFIIANG